MTCCFRPGEVVVLPREGGPETLEVNPERVYSASNILRIYSRGEGEGFIGHDAFKILQSFHARPFVLRVREGTEVETALALQERSNVASAVPNFRVRPSAEYSIFDAAIERVPTSTRFHGQDTRIAVVDTGIDPRTMAGRANLRSIQYDVETPHNGSPPRDDYGHGTTVARIIARVTPGVELQSIRALPDGTLAGVVMAIQIALSVFRPHVVNLSLGLDDPQQYCINCGHVVEQQFPEVQLHNFFEALDYNGSIEPPVYVVSAGNNSRVALPARCSNTLAVGAYDDANSSRPDYADYPDVPQDRFLMAYGATESSPFGKSWNDDAFYGTSFSAGVVASVAGAIAAQHGCELTMRQCVMRYLPIIADRNIPSFDPAQHGFGYLRSP